MLLRFFVALGMVMFTLMFIVMAVNAFGNAEMRSALNTILMHLNWETLLEALKVRG